MGGCTDLLLASDHRAEDPLVESSWWLWCVLRKACQIIEQLRAGEASLDMIGVGQRERFACGKTRLNSALNFGMCWRA
jgi:hypothetical protein